MPATSPRAVARILPAQPATAGTIAVRRALPGSETRSVGPWVFLDHFGPFRVVEDETGVGPHPHAGIETVTYLLSGRNEHRDSAGNQGIVTAGGAQWMTAGRGIVHTERPLADGAGETIQHGIQLWTSLPRALKMMPPRYQRIAATAIAQRTLPGATLRVIAGEVEGLTGPARSLMPAFLAHVTVDAASRVAVAVPPCHEAAAYVIEGEGDFGDATPAKAGDLVLFADGGGALPIANAGMRRLEVLLLGGAPAEGPLVFHGPFVMNSLEQVRAADLAYRCGRMGALEDRA